MDPVAKRLQRDALDVRENGTVTGKTYASPAVMQTMCWTVFVKRELSLRDKACNLPVDLPSNTHLWTQAFWNDLKYNIVNICCINESSETT